MEQQTLFKGRDRRKKGWFWMDNEYLNGYAKYFGAIGTAIYVSLCRHSDNETQKCFPAERTIAEELGIGERTVRKYIQIFKKYNIITIEREKHPITKKWLNNVYFMLDKECWIKPEASVACGKARGTKQQEPEATDDKNQRHVVPILKETHSKETNIKETHIAANAASEVFSLKDELTKLKDSPQRHIQLIGEYLEERKTGIESKEQLKVAVGRHLRAAADLAKFSDKQIGWASKKAAKDYPEWTLETVVKLLVK